MDSTTLNKLTIEIPYKSSLKEAILGFGAYLGLKGNSNNFLCETIKKETLKSNEREITNLRLNYGKHEIEYDNNLILINFQKIGKPVGLSYTAECFEEMYM